jgi:hypothetical protein
VAVSFVYAIAEIDREKNFPRAIKFGITSSDIDKRLSTLQTGNSNRLDHIGTLIFASEEMARICERLIHYNLKEHRVSGEWFTCNDEVMHFMDFGFQHYGHMIGDTPDLGLVVYEREAVVANG